MRKNKEIKKVRRYRAKLIRLHVSFLDERIEDALSRTIMTCDVVIAELKAAPEAE